LSESLRFGRAEVRPRERQLLVEGVPAGVGARAFEVLLALIERRDRLVTKNELLDLVWPGLVVEENNLQVQISSLRKLLGPHVIATVPGRGYRFAVALSGEGGHGLGTPGTTAAVPSEVHAGSALRTNLPTELPELFGREDDLQALCSLLVEHRLVTVVGAGGIGKSRLAQAAAHASLDRWPDGAWMIELAGLSDPAILPNTVAGTLDIKIEGQGSPMEQLIAAIAPRTMLLVLDNCEHLLDSVSQLVAAVLRAAPGVTLLATSQEPLRVPEEQQSRVTPLAVPPDVAAGHARDFGAVALFEARVQAVDPRFALTEDAATLAIDICRRLDGLPLAIELAAARVGTLGLRAVRDKLDARFKLLTGGARATLRRHQTLRAALEWSHGLLNDAERVVFRRLGVFAGGFTMELAQAVVVDEQLDEWAALDHMSALVDKSLVVADAGESPRYRLLESARAFALEQLAEGETADALRRHAVGMTKFLRRVDDINMDGELRTDQFAALVVPELDNLRAAYNWAISDAGDPKIAIALAAHTGSLIDYAAECADWLMPHLPVVEQGIVDDAVAARYWRALAAGNMWTRVPRQLRVEAAKRARSLYTALGKPRRVFSSLIRLVMYLLIEENEAAARAAFEKAKALIRPDWPAEFHIHLKRREGSLLRRAGRLAEALEVQRDEVRLSSATGDWRLEVIARSNFVDLLWQTQTLEEARQEARRLVEDLRRRPAALADTDLAFANLFGILSEMNLVEEASAAALEALPIMRRTHSYFLEEWVHLFWRRGQFDAAAMLLGAFDVERERTGSPLQLNEQRLMTAARAGLEKSMVAAAMANQLAAGAALGEAQLPQLLSEALAQTVRS
jgi:predicted ATPase/DNA-binding winged helix-turn-helix (wHTH) protein